MKICLSLARTNIIDYVLLLEQNFTNRGWELNNDEHLCNIRFKFIGTNEESEQKRYEILPAPSNR